jgi:hypothetical protein
MNNLDAVQIATDPTIKEIRFKRAYIHTSVDEKLRNLPEFMPLYDSWI